MFCTNFIFNTVVETVSSCFIALEFQIGKPSFYKYTYILSNKHKYAFCLSSTVSRYSYLETLICLLPINDLIIASFNNNRSFSN